MLREDLTRNFGFLLNDVARLMRKAYDRRAWRVYLGAEVGPAMRTMRAIAAGLRRDALAGLSSAERERFVDALLAIKANLARLD